MIPRVWAAIAVGKTVNFLLKLMGGGATAAPGYYALKLDPQLLRHLAKNLDKVIVVTGTNGKTTTSRFISAILAKKGLQTIHNKAGSNLVRGLVSTLIQQEAWGKTAIFEVDEATIPEVLSQITPNYLVLRRTK